jgi:hypothetical protein
MCSVNGAVLYGVRNSPKWHRLQPVLFLFCFNGAGLYRVRKLCRCLINMAAKSFSWCFALRRLGLSPRRHFTVVCLQFLQSRVDHDKADRSSLDCGVSASSALLTVCHPEPHRAMARSCRRLSRPLLCGSDSDSTDQNRRITPPKKSATRDASTAQHDRKAERALPHIYSDTH